MNEILNCKNISFKYREKSKENIVDNFSYSFEEGKIYLITGFSGCGKSTLSYILAGLYPQNKGILTNGKVILLGKNIDEYPPEKRAVEIMMMFQNADTQFCMDIVKDEIIFCLENIAFPVKDMDGTVDKVLNEAGIFYLKERKISSLSGGEKQKLALACILAVSPKIIILDEPFANVDYESSQKIIKLLKNFNLKNKTIIITIDHRISLWKDVCYNLISLEKGCRFSENNLKDFLNDDLEEGIYKQNIKKKKEKFSNVENAVEIENLSIGYEKNILLHNISLNLKKGSLTSIIGKSGTGKTSLLRIIAGIDKIKNGSIQIFGKEISKMKYSEFINSVGIIFQNPQNQFLTYKVIDEIIFTLKKKYSKKSEKDLTEKAEELLKEFNLYKYKNFSPFSLSQGQQRKLAVLSMLAADQKIILCDEPTYGQDNKTSIEIMEFLKRKSENGLTVLLVSHDKNLVFKYSDFVYKTTEEKIIREVEA